MSTDISQKHHHRRNSNETSDNDQSVEKEHKRIKKVKQTNEQPEQTIRKSKIINEEQPIEQHIEPEKEQHKRVKKVKQTNEQQVIDQPVTTIARRGRKIKYTTDEDRIAARRQQQREYRARKKQEMEDLKAFKQMNESKDPPTKTHKKQK